MDDTKGAGSGTATGTLSELQVAEQVGIPVDKVQAFCRGERVQQDGDGHYLIPTSLVGSIRSWAQAAGLLGSSTPGDRS